MFNSLQPHELQTARLLCPWDFPGKDTAVGCHFLLHGIFPTQGWNRCLQCCQVASLLQGFKLRGLGHGEPNKYANTNNIPKFHR